MEKYKIRKDLSIKYLGRTLYRIEALRNFSDVHIGDLGGWIEKYKNLDQSGDCWVYDNAKVYNHALIIDNVKIMDNVEVYNNAYICDNVTIKGYAHITSYIKTNDDFMVIGHVNDDGDYVTLQNNGILVMHLFTGLVDDFEKLMIIKYGADYPKKYHKTLNILKTVVNSFI